MFGKRLAIFLAACILFSGALAAGHHHHRGHGRLVRGSCAACAVIAKAERAEICIADEARPFTTYTLFVTPFTGLVVKLSPVGDKFIIRPPPA